MIQRFLARCPLVAILRGVHPDEVVAIGNALVTAGFAIIEVPLNSPEAFESIRRLALELGPNILVGAGTVTTQEQVERLAKAGGRLVVMPHSDHRVITAAKATGMICTPGVATPTEGFAALSHGADALKMFPAETLPPSALKAWLSVFPEGTRLFPVGGITPETMAPYVIAGAAGFGLGSALYRPGASPGEVAAHARAFIQAWTSLA